ncbi:MAG: tRNA-dihydrouridine synthase A [Francisellaceae bacterium]|jgi:tRNA-dihydrouridine synthase A
MPLELFSSDKDMTIAIAPMIDWTDRHYRYFMRKITKQTTLYTEMITSNAILNGDKDYLLGFDQSENPLILQLGGNNPTDLAECVKIAEERNYSEVNLNVGCPSERVQKGAFGLSMMNDPKLVASCVSAMKKNTKLPISIKCRIGVDDNDSYDALSSFIGQQVDAGVDHVCIHARKGWLKGLSPKENRTIPPLDYDCVYNIKQNFQNLILGINGGITTVSDITNHLSKLDYVLIGREAYHNPYLFSNIDGLFYGQKTRQLSRVEIIESLYPYIEQQLSNGYKLHHVTRHILGLFHGQPNGKLWRGYLSTKSTKENAETEVVKKALDLVR